MLPRSYLAAVLCAMVAGLGGCASSRVNLVEDGAVRVKVAECHRLTISAKVEQQGDTTVVSGIILPGPPRSLGDVHIDVDVTRPDGERVMSVVMPRPYVSLRSHRWAFEVAFPFVLQRDSQVFIKCDDSPHVVADGTPAS